MPRLWPIDRKTAPAATLQLLADVDEKLGMVPNLIATIAVSVSVLRGYLDWAAALSAGGLTEALREQIALAVSEANNCDYCVAGHSAVGSSIGLTDDELRDARLAASPDRRTEAALQFVRHVVDKRGSVTDDDINEFRDAGFGDSQLVEIVALVALNIFTNYINLVAQTEIDFPPAAAINQ